MSALSLPTTIRHRHVFDLSWPIMVSMLSYTAMTVADSIYIGQLGMTPLAAIGISTSLIYAGTAFGMGLLSGMRVAVAKATGADAHDLGRAYTWQGLWIALALGVVVAAFAPIGPWAFGWMGASDAVIPLASAYFGIRTLAAPLAFSSVALASYFQARGETKITMVAAVVANVVNIAVDPILIFGLGPIPAMGIHGAALATVLGMVFEIAILGGVAFRRLRTHMVFPDRDLLRPIWRVGAPMGLERLLDVGSFVLFASLLARAGEIHLAAHVIVVRIAMVSFLPGFAVAEASGVLVGQSLGAKRPHQAREAHRSATHLSMALMGVCGVLFVAMPDPLIRLFGAGPEVMEIARQLLMLAAVIQLFDALAMVALGSLSGAGDTAFVAKITVFASWVIKIPIAVTLITYADLGALGAWLGLAAEILFLAAAGCWRIRGDTWLESGEVEAPTA